MLDGFKKALDEENKRKDDTNENIIMPENANIEVLAEDGRPITPQIQEIMEMRDELSDKKPTNKEIVVRDTTVPAELAGKTIVSGLRDVPKLCDQCYLIDKCPHYKEGNSCYFRNQIQVEGRDSIVDLMKMLLEMQGERVLFGRLIEQSEGGYIDQNLSKEMKMLMDLMKDFKEVLAPPKEEVIIKASGPASGGGGGGGILSQLFGGGGNNNAT